MYSKIFELPGVLYKALNTWWYGCEEERQYPYQKREDYIKQYAAHCMKYHGEIISYCPRYRLPPSNWDVWHFYCEQNKEKPGCRKIARYFPSCSYSNHVAPKR